MMISRSLLIVLVASAPLLGQTTLDLGLGVVVRATDPTGIAFRILPGIAGELGLSRSISDRTRLRVDAGGQLFGEAVAMPDCIPGGDCRTRRSLTREAHGTVALERQLGAGVRKPSVFAGIGAYWTATGGRSVGDGQRSASAPGVNVGGSVGIRGVRAEGRVHVPLGDLAEVQMMSTALVRIPLVTLGGRR
jgi:hypothetical protein